MKLKEVQKMTYYFSPINRMLRHRIMPDAVNRVWREMEWDYSVPVDVKSTVDHYEIYALLPGLKAEDLSVNVINDTVTIEGEFKADRDEKAEYLLQERPDGKFTRTLRLPEVLNAGKTEATIENGILKVIVPKAEEAKPKTIKVVSK
jgi:HSP20 family protein